MYLIVFIYPFRLIMAIYIACTAATCDILVPCSSYNIHKLIILCWCWSDIGNTLLFAWFSQYAFLMLYLLQKGTFLGLGVTSITHFTAWYTTLSDTKARSEVYLSCHLLMLNDLGCLASWTRASWLNSVDLSTNVPFLFADLYNDCWNHQWPYSFVEIVHLVVCSDSSPYGCSVDLGLSQHCFCLMLRLNRISIHYRLIERFCIVHEVFLLPEECPWFWVELLSAPMCSCMQRKVSGLL